MHVYNVLWHLLPAAALHFCCHSNTALLTSNLQHMLTKRAHIKNIASCTKGKGRQVYQRHWPYYTVQTILHVCVCKIQFYSKVITIFYRNTDFKTQSSLFILALSCLFQINQHSVCSSQACKKQNWQLMNSYLTVLSSETLSAGTGVLRGVLLVVSGWQGQTQAPIEAGLAFTEFQMMAGLGWGWLSWGWGIQGKLEKRRVDPDTEPTAATSEGEQKDEHQGMAANTHHHPDLPSFLCVSLFSP